MKKIFFKKFQLQNFKIYKHEVFADYFSKIRLFKNRGADFNTRGTPERNKNLVTKVRGGIKEKITPRVTQAPQAATKGTKIHNDSRIPVGARLYPFRRAWHGAAHETISCLAIICNLQSPVP